jgi:hypothetical protein
VSVVLPNRGSWWSGGARGALRRALKKAAGSGGTVHLAIDAGRFAEQEVLNPREIEQVLEVAVSQRDAGQLTVLTLGDLTASFGARRDHAPMRSILRPAA